MKALRVRSPENLHELRKRIKDHWYHVRLLEGIWSETMGAREKSLKALETWLGEDHNLFVLSERLIAEPAKYGTKRGLESVLQSIRSWQTELRDRALPLAERVYEEKPFEFTRRMKHLWQIWKSEADSIPDALPKRKTPTQDHPIPAA
jgi:CHAD domain-containing protein